MAINQEDVGTTYLQYGDGKDLLIRENGTEHARFNNTGNFGIEATNPAFAKLQVHTAGLMTLAAAGQNGHNGGAQDALLFIAVVKTTTKMFSRYTVVYNLRCKSHSTACSVISSVTNIRINQCGACLTSSFIGANKILVIT